ncbi:alpha/beta fold hydrolase [Thalassoroseus pseudoceratinae]|uniref:alpha/beta fold hydrolase n=1 Tax=Thalassoroseus pseudoceratinae TaxID=2713176 RepID=UPI0014232644|nr:alpha/beta fold hydrolase [Thalassoroseus pseudoceratinae]
MTETLSTSPHHSRVGFAEEYPFESRFLEIDGHRIHYIDEGSGPTLLMVHGNPTWSFAWRNLVKDLSQDYRVLAIDHLGCGFSDKPQDYDYRLANHIQNLTAFITELGLSEITLFAHDWGGAIGMGAASRLPDRFRKFVLFNTAAFRSLEIPLRIAVCRTPILGSVMLRGLNGFSRAALRMAVSKPERITKAVRRGYLAPYDNWANRIAVHRFVADIPLKKSHPSYETLTEVESGLKQFQSHPMLLVWGEQDFCFTTNFLKEWQLRFPNAETLSFPDAGHYVFDDAHERILPKVREFLEDSDSES